MLVDLILVPVEKGQYAGFNRSRRVRRNRDSPMSMRHLVRGHPWQVGHRPTRCLTDGSEKQARAVNAGHPAPPESVRNTNRSKKQSMKLSFLPEEMARHAKGFTPETSMTFCASSLLFAMEVLPMIIVPVMRSYSYLTVGHHGGM